MCVFILYRGQLLSSSAIINTLQTITRTLHTLIEVLECYSSRDEAANTNHGACPLQVTLCWPVLSSLLSARTGKTLKIANLTSTLSSGITPAQQRLVTSCTLCPIHMAWWDPQRIAIVSRPLHANPARFARTGFCFVIWCMWYVWVPSFNSSGRANMLEVACHAWPCALDAHACMETIYPNALMGSSAQCTTSFMLILQDG